MKSYKSMSSAELESELNALRQRYEDYKAMGLKINMMRGQPSPEQLDLSNHLFDGIADSGYKAQDGSDVRNYGNPAGLSEARKVFADIIGTEADNLFLGNSSSLNMMFDTLMRAMVFGEIDSDKPWSQIEGRKWLCPAPGYDRHFRVTETLGFELITVPMTENGPDMDIVEKLVAEDDKILGIWNVPVYTNPEGVVYSEETCRRMASMKTAAKDFRIMWDNAYVCHHLFDDESERGKVPDMLKLCADAGYPNRVYEFASSSKVTFAGGGLSCFAANSENLARAKKYMGVQSICSNKVNQYAHVRFLPTAEAVDEIMRKHAAILRPKFKTVIDILTEEFDSNTDVCRWTNPKGGYFVSFYALPGTAGKTVAMCADAGVSLTPAGASYPYGKDPDDTNIRLAPSFPQPSEIEKAIRILSVCAKITAVEKLLEEKQ